MSMDCRLKSPHLHRMIVLSQGRKLPSRLRQWTTGKRYYAGNRKDGFDRSENRSTKRQNKASLNDEDASSYPYYIQRSPNKRSVYQFLGPLSPPRNPETPGENFLSAPTSNKYYSHTPGKTNYVTGHPTQVFPLNPYFHAHGIVPEHIRVQIYTLSEGGHDPFVIAEKFGLSRERVNAIIRLKREELKWKQASHPEHKRSGDLRRMSETIRSMLPQHPLQEAVFEESISSKTEQNIFITIPEGATYTREDASKEFNIREKKKEVKEYPKIKVDHGRYTWIIEDRPFRDEVHAWGGARQNDKRRGFRKLW